MSSSETKKLPNQPLQPLGHAFDFQGGEPGVTLEVFVDYHCPFSARIFKRLTTEVIPYYNTQASKNLKVIFQQIPQPWHPQSGLMHEAVIAVRHLYGLAKCNKFQTVLFNDQPNYADTVTMYKTRIQISDGLAALAATLDNVDKQAVLDRLTIDETIENKNIGSKSCRMLKFYIKQQRQLGIHVSPTCRVNNMIVDTSSGWTLEQWQEYLNPLFERATEDQLS